MTSTDQETVQSEIAAVIETAITDGVSSERIEAVLQREAQNVRQGRRVTEVFNFECTVDPCRETATRTIDRSALYCDVCGEQLDLVASTVDVDEEIEVMKFTCDEHDTVRAHRVPQNDRTCPHHHQQMELVESHVQEVTGCYER